MSARLLAALDDSAAAKPVLATAQRLAPMVDAEVVAIHVTEQPDGATAHALADAAGIDLQVRVGDVAQSLIAAAHEHGVRGIVVGARRANWTSLPAGHVALQIAQDVDWPVIIVPPDAPDRPVRRVLVAVEGDSESETLDMLASSLQAEQWPEIIALHVFEPDTLPMFADQPVHETDAWAQEFLHRVPHARHKHVRLEVRIGRAPDVVRNVSRELNVDMVVLSWRHDLGAGHAPIVREMLASSAVPLLLLPAAPQ